MIIEETLFKDKYKELNPICLKHWEELGEVGGSTTYELDVELILRMEELGIYKLVTVSNDSGYIGYASWIISRGIHSARSTYATTDAVYILPEYRDNLSGAGYKLLNKSEEILHNKYDINIIQFSMNVNYDISNVLRKMGYLDCEIKFSKRLGG